MDAATIKAVLGPTNTGKTHLAIERMCAHSSGVMGFPLRLLAREVYDRVCAIKGERNVALITGEQRIEPETARYFCCTAEAMPRDGGDAAFVALDEVQLAADRERGHIFTDRLLHARGREETMLLGAATVQPLLRTLEPRAELVERPRFSTISHIGPRKLSRLPPRSAIVAFSIEQVYATAEMLRRFRGGAAVVMGALSPETRNRQVAMFQAGEVDYIVATDAIGMGLNLDLHHVAFAGLTKFDGQRQRRLHPAEMAQIAGRAGRHQRDGTFGVLAGAPGNGHQRGPALAFTDEEVFAIEEHRFAPLTRLFWRDPEPSFDNLPTLIADLERSPDDAVLASAPEAIDLAVLKRLHDEPIARSVTGPGQVRRFWEACSLPDFRQQGVEMHARFVARLWQDLQGGYLGADFVAQRIAELDNVQGDIDTLQGRIAAIRSWAYICQRPDWVLARDEMAARARAAEARLSDALHGRLTERFVNRRTSLLMKSMGRDAALLPIGVRDSGQVIVEDEVLGRLKGFRFIVDPAAGHEDHRMLLAAAEKALPRILAARATKLVDSGLAGLGLDRGSIVWEGRALATLRSVGDRVKPDLSASRDLDLLPEASKRHLLGALDVWLDRALAPLVPLQTLIDAANDPAIGSQGRGLLHALIGGHGYLARKEAGLEHLPRELRPVLRRLGVTFGSLDIFVPALLKPAARRLLHALDRDRRALQPVMTPVIAPGRVLPAGYRRAGQHAIRLDLAHKLLTAAHQARTNGRGRTFAIDPALAISTGLTMHSFAHLLGQAGFRQVRHRALALGMFGPAAPVMWEWRPQRRTGRPAPAAEPARPHAGNAFAQLAGLLD